MTRVQPRRASLTLFIAAAAAMTLGACSSSTKTATSTTKPSVSTETPSTGANVLTIKNLAFSTLTVKAGDSISIVNADSTDHTVTADNGTFDIAAAAGSTTALVVPKAGTYAIHCKIHASMHGTITVT